MKKKINIMYIIDYLYGGSGGGTETHLSYLTQFLNKDIFECIIVAFDMSDTPFVIKMKENGANIIHVPVGRYYNLNAIKQALHLSGVIKKRQIDMVQTFHFKSDVYGALVAKLSGVKYVISSKRDVGDRKTKWHFFLHKHFRFLINRYIVVANRVGKLINHKEKASLKKIRTIYNGVDILKFYPPNLTDKINARYKIELTKNDFVIGMVAVFRPEKNHDIFFQGFMKVLKDIKPLKAVMVGDGKLLPYYKELCKKNDLLNKVIFTGATNNVYQYLKTFDIACLIPGSNEGFSNSILEKMATGLPLIVTDVGGNAEAVSHEENGLVIPPYDSNAFAFAIKQLYSSQEKREIMGMESRRRAEKYFSLEKMIKQHEDYYLEILNENK